MLPLVKFCDKLTDACIRGLRGYDCARAFSYWIDELSLRFTHLVDFLVYGCGRRATYEAAALEEGSTSPASRPSIARARLFRRKYCMPRRRLVRQPDGALHWERLNPGEGTVHFLRTRLFQSTLLITPPPYCFANLGSRALLLPFLDSRGRGLTMSATFRWLRSPSSATDGCSTFGR